MDASHPTKPSTSGGLPVSRHFLDETGRRATARSHGSPIRGWTDPMRRSTSPANTLEVSSNLRTNCGNARLQIARERRPTAGYPPFAPLSLACRVGLLPWAAVLLRSTPPTPASPSTPPTWDGGAPKRESMPSVPQTPAGDLALETTRCHPRLQRLPPPIRGPVAPRLRPRIGRGHGRDSR